MNKTAQTNVVKLNMEQVSIDLNRSIGQAEALRLLATHLDELPEPSDFFVHDITFVSESDRSVLLAMIERF